MEVLSEHVREVSKHKDLHHLECHAQVHVTLTSSNKGREEANGNSSSNGSNDDDHKVTNNKTDGDRFRVTAGEKSVRL